VRKALGPALDAALLCSFAAIGRRNHGETGALLAVASTAWPFLAGMTASWVISVLTLGHLPLKVRDGIPIWLGTVSIAMVLRSLTHAGTASSFIAVATVFVGGTFLGWRAVAALVISRREARASQLIRQP